MFGATLPPAHARARNRNWDLEQEHDYKSRVRDGSTAAFGAGITAHGGARQKNYRNQTRATSLRLHLDFSIHHDSMRLFFHHFKPEPFVETKNGFALDEAQRDP